VPRLRLRARPSFISSLIVALASGAVLSLAFPPAGLWPLAFLAPVPLLWLLRDVRSGRGFVLGLVFGIGFYGATLYWIARFGTMAWVALTLVSAVGVGLFGLLAPVLRPAFTSNHHKVMLQGAQGLAALLGATLVAAG